MVEHEEGSAPNLKIKFAFDDMRRVAVEDRDFFYAPVNGTPFTLGLVLPPNYGRFTIGLGEKFRKIERAGITATNYFHGKNWRIHPEWIYCKHDHDALHEFSNPEERLMDFLRKRDQSTNWKWSSHPKTKRESDSEGLGVCDRKPIPENSYHCDQDLVERLMLEAKALNSWYGTDTWDLRDKKERDAVQQFNVSMRFVATHGGLTRWQHVPDSEEPETAFGDWNNRAIDEDWYRAAVLLHEESPDSFLFSAPFESGSNPDAPITGYTAVYHQDGGFEVPAAVVGFQMPLSEVQKHMLTVTEALSSPECMNSTTLESCGCSSEEIACYMLDANGYVVVSEEVNDTGRFFGDVAPDAMVALHRLQVYRKIPMYDYQALCIWEVQVHSGAAELLITPFRWIQWILGWIVGQFIQILANDLLWSSTHALEDVLYDDYDLPEVPSVIDIPAGEDSDKKEVKITIRVDSEPCDKLRYLALLELTANNGSRVYIAPPPDYDPETTPSGDDVNFNETSTEQPESSSENPVSSAEMQADQPLEDEPAVTEANIKEKEDKEDDDLEVKDEIEEEIDEELEDLVIGDDMTEKPFVFIGRSVIAQRVPFTNLVLVIVDGLRPEAEAGPERWSPEAIQVSYGNVTHPCHKLPLNDLPRRRLAGCLSEHPLESEIEQCGRAGLQGAAHGLLTAMFLLASIVPYLATIPH